MHHAVPLTVGTSETDAWDETAVIRAAQVSSAAFAPLYDRYLTRVYRYVRARVDSDDAAADLTQDIFLRVLDALPAYRPRGAPFAAWLFRIARNAVTDVHRRRRPSASLDSLPEMPRAEHGDPEQAALRDEALRRLLHLLTQIDPAKRELLALRFAAGLTAPEIALGSVMLYDRGSQPVSAEAILDRAQVVTANTTATGISSYHLRATSTERWDGTAVTMTTESWFAGNGRMRTEQQIQNASGTVISVAGKVTNGTQLWVYSTEQEQTRVQIVDVRGSAATTDAKVWNGGITSLPDLLAAYNAKVKCESLTARQQGEGTVAGRAVYVIELAGQERCPGKPGQTPIARTVISVDKQTFVPLKTESFAADGSLRSRFETTSIEYDVTIPDSTFTHTPPPGAVITTGPDAKPATPTSTSTPTPTPMSTSTPPATPTPTTTP